MWKSDFFQNEKRNHYLTEMGKCSHQIHIT